MTNEERQFIQIEMDEDANSVKDRLAFYKGKRVLLIWPEEGTALTRKLDLVLIQREAMRRQIKLAFVTHDQQVIQHAQELSISTFQTIGASERGRWRRGRTRVFTGRERRPSVLPTAEELEEVASRKYKKRGFNLTMMGVIVRVVILAVVLGAAFGGFYFAVPQATVTLTPGMQSINIDVQITVNPTEGFSNIDIENAVLPALRVSVEIEETASIPTTGEQNLGDTSATGEAVFINRTEAEVEVPPGTIISTSAGEPITFRTTEAGIIPAGDGVEVTIPIEAMPGSSGAIGNVDANMINTVVGILAEQISVINPRPTRGGDTRALPIVSANDRERLNTQVNQLIQQRAFVEIESLPQIGPGQYIILETLRITQERDEWTRFSALPGAQAETLSLTKRAVVEVVVVDTNLGQQIVFARMASQIPRGRIFDPDSINYVLGDVTIDEGLIMFTMSGSGLVVGQVNEAQIQTSIANMTLDQAMQYLMDNVDLQPGSSPEITVSPDIFGRLPIWPERIMIEVLDP